MSIFKPYDGYVYATFNKQDPPKVIHEGYGGMLVPGPSPAPSMAPGPSYGPAPSPASKTYVRIIDDARKAELLSGLTDANGNMIFPYGRKLKDTK
jgi:hypothetical protein